VAKKLRSATTFPEEDFPLRAMRVKSHGTSDFHSHEFHELVVILGGTGLHRTSEGEYPLNPGSVFLIRGDTEHSYADTDRMHLVNVLFAPRRLSLPTVDLRRLPGYHVLFRIEPGLRSQHKLRGCLMLSTEQLALVAQTIALLEDELGARRPGYRFMSITHLMHLIGFLSRCESDAAQPERRQLLKVGEVLSHIENHYDSPLTVDGLCEVAGMSESSLVRTFHSVVGRPPMDHVISVRVAKAAELLATSDIRITDVAFRCGFADSNYFSRQFRKTLNMSPREYRRREGRGPAC
jgi:AraC-like DNA-binding protein